MALPTGQCALDWGVGERGEGFSIKVTPFLLTVSIKHTVPLEQPMEGLLFFPICKMER